KIGKFIAKTIEGEEPSLKDGKWTKPPEIAVPDNLRRAMAHYMHLINHFADPVHFGAEQAMLEVAIACGMPADKARWVFDHHDQARAYWSCLNVAWRRIQSGDPDDRYYALRDFQSSIEAFVYLFKAHAVRENDETYPTAGSFFNDSDDSLVL